MPKDAEKLLLPQTEHRSDFEISSDEASYSQTSQTQLETLSELLELLTSKMENLEAELYASQNKNRTLAAKNHKLKSQINNLKIHRQFLEQETATAIKVIEQSSKVITENAKIEKSLMDKNLQIKTEKACLQLENSTLKTKLKHYESKQNSISPKSPTTNPEKSISRIGWFHNAPKKSASEINLRCIKK